MKGSIALNYLRTTKADLRTHVGRRIEIMRQIAEHGGFSTFWISGNPLRAIVAQQMIDNKMIILRGGKFPWHNASLNPTYK